MFLFSQQRRDRERSRNLTLRGLISLAIVRLFAAHRIEGVPRDAQRIIDEVIETLQQARKVLED